MDNVCFVTIEFRSDWQVAAVRLRDEVLRRPLGLVFDEDDLAKEKDDIHIAALADGEVVGCLVLSRVDDDVVQMRQVAVRGDFQRCGVGRNMVEYSERVAVENGYKKIMLHARDIAIAFYEKLGYGPVGDMFVEIGIVHQEMAKEIR